MSSSITPLGMEFPQALEGEENAALKSTFAIASVGIATLKMLETLLPAAAGEVERESQSLADNFSALVEHVNSQCTPPLPITEAITGIIMGMQFQDRNTQIMENVAVILERYRNILEDVCRNIELRDGNIASAHNITGAIENILSGIRLSDIRTRYMDALAKANVHSGEGTTEASHVGLEDIELF
mgnify:CR=1 FL=1